MYPFRVAHWLSAGIGTLALLLTISGIYGLLSYTLSQPTRDIGIRMAPGATVRAVTGIVLGQSLRLCGIGVTIGTTLALGASTILSSALVMMDTFDVLGYASGIVIVVAACLVAALGPARNAARIEPVVALRAE